MNKYLLRGLLCLIVGSSAVFYGFRLMHSEISLYKWVMGFGVLIFGIGFLVTMYSLFRKMDRRAVQQYRREQHRKKI